MPCFHPITAWYSATKNGSGKRSLVFSAAGGFGLPLQICCNQCIGCRTEHARQWAIRCVHENQFHAESSFLTLTYSPENLPEFGSLVPDHLQLFLKRLRFALAPKRVRFFACGEYGESRERPHYHVLLFGHAFYDDRKLYTTTEFGPLYSSEILDSLWGLGQCRIGAVTLESAGYVARYSLKKVTGQLAADHYTRLDLRTGEIIQLRPEFIRMSLRPGIGSRWLEQFKSDVYPDDFVVQKGKKLRVPRFYDGRLPADELVAVKAARKLRARSHAKNNTPTRLLVREEVVRSKIKTLKRS